MKKKLFGIVYVAYFLIGFTGFFKFRLYAYTEQDSWNKVLHDHFWIILLAAFIMGDLLFIFYKTACPEQYEKRKNRFGFKIYMPFLCVLLSFLLNLGSLFHIDTLMGDKGKLVINGIVMNKRTRPGSKGGMNYFVSISDTVTKLNYYFEVKRKVYYSYTWNESVHKEFSISRLGIIYRKEE